MLPSVSSESNLFSYPFTAGDLARSCLTIFSASLHELNTFVSFCRNNILSLPRSHPQRISCLSPWAFSLLARYKVSRQMDDLEQSILRLTELIFLPRSWGWPPINTLQIFFHISIALFFSRQ